MPGTRCGVDAAAGVGFRMRRVLRAFATAGLLAAVSCGSSAEVPSGAPEASTPTATASASALPTEAPSPSATPSAEVLELRADGLGDTSFGDPMAQVVRALEDALGTPADDLRRHGSMPLGFGDVDTTTRQLTWPGLIVLFQDWEGYYLDDGTMHLIGWVASNPTTGDIALRTPEGISVSSTIGELREAYRAELDVKRAACWGRVSFFWVGSDPFDQLRGSLNGFPRDPDALVTRLDSGAPAEGMDVC